MYQFDTHFTREEADALLPVIRKLFLRVHRLLGAPVKTSAAARVGSFAHEGPRARIAEPGEDPLPGSMEERRREVQQILQTLIDRGIILRDVARGLIDFPHLLDGKDEVFLCWDLADPDHIDHYHRLDEGYSGRVSF